MPPSAKSSKSWKPSSARAEVPLSRLGEGQGEGRGEICAHPPETPRKRCREGLREAQAERVPPVRKRARRPPPRQKAADPNRKPCGRGCGSDRCRTQSPCGQTYILTPPCGEWGITPDFSHPVGDLQPPERTGKRAVIPNSAVPTSASNQIKITLSLFNKDLRRPGIVESLRSTRNAIGSLMRSNELA